MISDANPGISPTAPPHEETGYYQPPPGSNILPTDSQSERGSGSLPEGHSSPENTRRRMGKREMETRWRGRFWPTVWSVIKGDNVKGFKFVKPGRAGVSWGVFAPGAGLALAVK